MKRYWEVKCKQFDKIVLYRYGSWFIVYYQDAEICHRYIYIMIPPRMPGTILGFHQNYLE